jgi:hypothetical protein
MTTLDAAFDAAYDRDYAEHGYRDVAPRQVARRYWDAALAVELPILLHPDGGVWFGYDAPEGYVPIDRNPAMAEKRPPELWTREQFEAAYADGNVARWLPYQRLSIECHEPHDSGYPDCHGWQMITLDRIADELEMGHISPAEVEAALTHRETLLDRLEGRSS